jgi:hypothetical protein
MPSLFALQQWLGEQIVPLFFIGFAVLMGFALVFFSAQTRKASRNRDRSGHTEDTFAEHLATYGFDPEIARTTYSYLQERQNVAFPIEPTDDLDRDFGLYGQDLDSVVRDLLHQTGRAYLPGLLESPLVTVVDLVRYVQASPRRTAVPRRRSA